MTTTTTKTTLFIGLNDKDTLFQIIDDINFYIDIIASTFSEFNCTITQCKGCYRMQSNGIIIQENTIKVELYNLYYLANPGQFDNEIKDKINYIKRVFNQESILIEHSQVEVDLV